MSEKDLLLERLGKVYAAPLTRPRTNMSTASLRMAAWRFEGTQIAIHHIFRETLIWLPLRLRGQNFKIHVIELLDDMLCPEIRIPA